MSKHACVMDCEVYRNYFLVAFRNVKTGNTRAFELFGEGAVLTPSDIKQIRAILRTMRIVTFNGRNYDMPILSLALTGAPCTKLKEGSDAIILGSMRYWDFEKRFRVVIPTDIEHVDLIDVSPGQASLKIYGGRLHTRKMQDLPLPPDAIVTEEQLPMMREYNGNDLNATIDLHNSLTEQLALRERMSEEYGIDLMSKSDAQIAEAVIRKQVEDLTESRVLKPGSRVGDRFRYNVPDWLHYTTPQLNEVLERVRNTWFVVNEKGAVALPDSLATARVGLGGSTYRMGIGGLHSSEECVAHHAKDGYKLYDLDVTSYYPSIILNQGLYPEQMGEAFLKVYQEIVDRRIAAKRANDKVVADSLKITINGSFGKLGSKWSYLYSPELMIQVTLTGQLALLMLIEALESVGVSVVSGNTDGIIVKIHESEIYKLDEMAGMWEGDTGFNLERTEYMSVYSKDVNNYIAIKPDGKHKAKGAYADEGLQKNPSNLICSEAVINLLTDGVLIDDTIMNCTDVRKFISIRQVKGGAIDHYGRYLGKAVRWYYAHYTAGDLVGDPAIYYQSNMNLVARSEGAKPLMELPDHLPADLNHQWYLDEAQSILRDIGVRA